jgi:transposase
MLFAGCDLHKETISVCVVDQARTVLHRQRLACREEEILRCYFSKLGDFQVVVEATASYEWFVKLVEPLARKVVLAHPKKLRIIAESTRKSDKLDAQVLAEFLACGMIPAAHRPTPRQREHRVLVRQRDRIQRRLTSVKNRLRRILANYNADIPGLFTIAGLQYLASVPLSEAERFTVDQILEEFQLGRSQLKHVEERLRQFVADSPLQEQEARKLLCSIPGVGFVTAEVVLAELAGVERFRSQKKVVAYAGLSPGQRESAGKQRSLHLEKQGSQLLRGVLVEAAWRLVQHSPHWRGIYERLKARVRAKKAIVAVARRLLCLITAVLTSGQPYSATYQPSPPQSLRVIAHRPKRRVSALEPKGH